MAATTQNAPIQNIRAKATLRFGCILRPKMKGSGRHRTIRSSTKLLATCASPRALVSNFKATCVSGNETGSISRRRSRKNRIAQTETTAIEH
jgi:hypothetical protein